MNRKLALPDEILLRIEKPARYLGNEINAVYKDPDSYPEGTHVPP